MVIAVRDLTVRFRTAGRIFTAVDGVDFRVEAGESFGIVGESGSGKSTLLRALSGLIDDWQGDIEIAGYRREPRHPRFLPRAVQMIFQDPVSALHPRHTVERALAEPLRANAFADIGARIAKAMLEVGLDTGLRRRYPHELSGGQRQRVAIARALVVEPAILLLDELTSALDVSVQAGILNLLTRLRAEKRLTYVLVSHDLAVVAHLCPRVGVMLRGRLVEELSAEDLRAGRAAHAYTRSLIEASKGYRPGLAAAY